MKKTIILAIFMVGLILVFQFKQGNSTIRIGKASCPSNDAVPCCNNGYLPNVSQFSLCCINSQGQMVEVIISGSCCEHLWYINGNNPPSPYAECKECRD